MVLSTHFCRLLILEIHGQGRAQLGKHGDPRQLFWEKIKSGLREEEEDAGRAQEAGGADRNPLPKLQAGVLCGICCTNLPERAPVGGL